MATTPIPLRCALGTPGGRGNAIKRINVSQTIAMPYNAENWLTGLSGGVTASYVYDGDGNRVKETSGVTTTVYIGAYYEWTGSTATMKSYYYGGTRVAMRTGTPVTGTVNYLLTDHLGSTAVVTHQGGGVVAQQLYKPWGESRWTNGTLPTDRKFTGQRSEEATLGSLYDFQARAYSPRLGRFLSADTIVPSPGDPQSLNRYAYSLNNPLKYVDPSGHFPIPPSIPIVEILKHPYIAPLWTNPFIGVPVALGLYREAKGDAPEALSLTLNWYFERGEAPRDIGSESEITQFLITSPGVQEARKKFTESGGKDMVGLGGALRHEFTWEAITELYKGIHDDEWSGSFLGSYDVEIRNLRGHEGPEKLVEVTVINDTGWQSATKIPFTQITIRKNVDRSEPGPGGTLWQFYIWQEVINAE